MAHRVKKAKLGRTTSARTALLRGLVAALVEKGEIKTTQPKAKAVKGYFDSLVIKAAKGGLARKREILAELGGDKKTTDELFGRLAKGANGATGGFTRIVNLGRRRGDRAMIAKLTLLIRPEEQKEERKAGEKAPSKKAAEKKPKRESKK